MIRNELFTQNIFLCLAFLILSWQIYNKAYENRKTICDNYVLNTYLYLSLSFIIVFLFVINLQYSNTFKNYLPFRYTGMGFILEIVSLFSLLMLVLNISPNNIISKHLLWIALLFIISLRTTTIYLMTKQNGIFLSTAFVTSLIMISLSVFAHFKPDSISLNLGSLLLIGLVSGILLEIVLFVMNTKNIRFYHKILSYFFVLIFSGFILWDTKKLQLNAKNCKKSPDYIKESFNLFLNVLNLFSNLSYSRNKR